MAAEGDAEKTAGAKEELVTTVTDIAGGSPGKVAREYILINFFKEDTMSIIKASLDGKYVYAADGEALRGKDVVCMHCGAKMHIHRFPGKIVYFFALNPGEKHTSVCQNYDGEKEAPVITRVSPDQLIDIISTVSRPSGPRSGAVSPGTGGSKVPTGGGVDYVPKRITKITQIIETGMFDEMPYEIPVQGRKDIQGYDDKYRLVEKSGYGDHQYEFKVLFF